VICTRAGQRCLFWYTDILTNISEMPAGKGHIAQPIFPSQISQTST